MAFRKSSRYRSSWRKKKIPASRIPRSIARVRKQRVVAFNTMQACEHTCVEDSGLCTTDIRISILRNVDLQQLFGDNCKVANIRGSVWIDPWFKPPYSITNQEYGEDSDWLVFADLMSRTILQGRAGLIKTFANSDDPTNPLPDYLIHDSFDWSEAPWIKQWNHMWFCKETYQIQHQLQSSTTIIGLVSKPDTGSVVNALAAGTGNINTQTGAITTACFGCTPGNDDGPLQAAYRTTPAIRPWRIPINIRKDITMKENQNLELAVSFSSLHPGSDCFPAEDDLCEVNGHAFPCIFRIVPNVMLTIQYG